MYPSYVRFLRQIECFMPVRLGFSYIKSVKSKIMFKCLANQTTVSYYTCENRFTCNLVIWVSNPSASDTDFYIIILDTAELPP